MQKNSPLRFHLAIDSLKLVSWSSPAFRTSTTNSIRSHGGRQIAGRDKLSMRCTVKNKVAGDSMCSSFDLLRKISRLSDIQSSGGWVMSSAIKFSRARKNKCYPSEHLIQFSDNVSAVHR
jgi:hypothetical protein